MNGLEQSLTSAILITIPLSHYCGKARWGLDRVALPYVEPHAPLFSRLVSKRRERGTVPVLVYEGRRFVDSADILRFADEAGGGDLLYPRDLELRSEVESLEMVRLGTGAAHEALGLRDVAAGKGSCCAGSGLAGYRAWRRLWS